VIFGDLKFQIKPPRKPQNHYGGFVGNHWKNGWYVE